MNLDRISIITAFSKFGIRLSFKEESSEDSPLVGTMRMLVFTTQGFHRELTICLAKTRVSLFVEDESKIHRSMYTIDNPGSFSLNEFVECINKKPAMIASLKGAEVVDTPIDWRDYK